MDPLQFRRALDNMRVDMDSKYPKVKSQIDPLKARTIAAKPPVSAAAAAAGPSQPEDVEAFSEEEEKEDTPRAKSEPQAIPRRKSLPKNGSTSLLGKVLGRS